MRRGALARPLAGVSNSHALGAGAFDETAEFARGNIEKRLQLVAIAIDDAIEKLATRDVFEQVVVAH